MQPRKCFKYCCAEYENTSTRANEASNFSLNELINVEATGTHFCMYLYVAYTTSSSRYYPLTTKSERVNHISIWP
jgi:hypothetical protein